MGEVRSMAGFEQKAEEEDRTGRQGLPCLWGMDGIPLGYEFGTLWLLAEGLLSLVEQRDVWDIVTIWGELLQRGIGRRHDSVLLEKVG